jgi:hypothetical protein
MNQPEPHGRSFSALIGDIEAGRIKIPQFQRDFVWTREKSAKLIDSILRGYPIGTFILWKTKEQLRTVRNIGNAQLPDTPSGDYAQQVLDGQQRLTSLYASVKGLTVERNGVEESYADIFVDLEASDERDLVVTDVHGRPEMSYIRVMELVKADLKFLTGFPPMYYEKLSLYRDRLQSYSFSVILVTEAPIDMATEIFTRINVTGKPLSVFEIMVAKTFDPDRDFDLAERYDALIEDLAGINYGTIPSAVVLQTVAAILAKDVRKKVILGLNRSAFIDVWPKAVDALERAVEYFRNTYRIPVSNLLPYPGLLIPFSYYFHHHPDKPTGEQKDYLKDFFWRVALTGRYSGTTETSIGQDLRSVDEILGNKLPNLDFGVDPSPAFIRNHGFFNAGRSFIKAILCLLAYREPKSFLDDALVRIDNDWLKQANSRNYHHFFPKAFLTRKRYPYPLINHVGNITIVDDFLNKREIRDKAPSVYMARFRKKNPNLPQTMRTHLINLENSGIWEDDYERFLKMRCRLISDELKKRIILRTIDKPGQAQVIDIVEEVEPEEEAVQQESV